MKDIERFTLYGVLWILANNLNMSVQTATIKWLSGSLGSAQIVFLYKLTVWVFILLWVSVKGFGQLKTQKLHLHFLRALLSITGALIYVHALKHIPLASAMAVGFTEPLFTTLWAVVLLKELFNKYMLFALGIGFTGTLIALNPSSESFSVYSLWVLAASIVWSADNLVIKFLGKTEKSVQYLFFISLFSTLFSAPVAIKVWQPVTLQHVPSILALAIFYFIHVIAVFKAFQYSNLSILAPFDFSRIVFSTFIGVLFFKDKINLWEITGALLIVFSSAYIVWKKEYDKNKRKLPRNLNPAANDV